MRHAKAGVSRGHSSWRSGAYVAGLMALGLTVGLARGQAVDPVNISGKKKAAPEAAVPTVTPAAAPAPVAAPSAPAAAPAAVPEAAPVAPPGANGSGAMVPVADAPAQPVTPPNVPTSPPMPPPVAPPAAPTAPVVPGDTTPAAPTPPLTLTPTPATTSPNETQPAATNPVAADDKAYPITELRINYFKEGPGQPAMAKLMATQIKLGVMNDGYVAPRGEAKIVTVALGDVGKKGITKIYRSGIEAIYGQVVKFYNDRGIAGVYVVVDAADIGPNSRDMRPEDRTSLQMIVVTSRIREIRTVDKGEVSGQERVDLPQFRAIKDNSPLKSDGTESGRMDLLNKDVLDDYVMRLNRQPGRHVNIALSGTDHPGEIDLDYLVTETKPWYAYAGVSNTGTKQTDPWRERFGFVDNELTGHDDILSFDYVTAAFTKSHSVVGSYEVPFFNFDRLRYKIFSTYNQFTASDVGQNLEHFTGNEWTIGNELSLNIFQQKELFIDVVGGFRFQEVTTNDQTSGIQGDAQYMVPYGGLRLNRSTELASTAASLTLVSYNTGANQAELEGLGRTDPTRDPIVLQFEAAQSAYLEPLLDPEGFASGKSTLAHEIYLAVHGQYAFNSRLFPQAEDVAGGFYSVRGYPESIVAGDSVAVATAEYRFHFPRILPVQSDPSKTPFLWDKSFRFAPSQTYGRPDWDLIARAFVDVGEVINNDRQTFEFNSTLVGTGVGIELQYKQHFNLRVDWGVALTDVPGMVEVGNNRFHISATILY